MANTSPWNGNPVTIISAEQGTMLALRATREGDNPNMVFKTNGKEAQLEDLFATLAAAKMPVKALNFGMYGDVKGDNGRPKAIVAAIQETYQDKATGAEKSANFAYTPEQLDAFTPQSFVMLTKWVPKRGGGKFPAPLFLVHALPYERTRQVQEMGFQRVTVRQAVEQPKTIKRAVAASKA